MTDDEQLRATCLGLAIQLGPRPGWGNTDLTKVIKLAERVRVYVQTGEIPMEGPPAWPHGPWNADSGGG